MPSIVSYRKYIDPLITRELLLPDDPATHQRLGTELATVDGVTYVSLPDGAVLPAAQPAEIAASIGPAALTPALRDALKAASPHLRLIAQRVRDKIALRYSPEDEIALIRTAPSGEFDAYNVYAEECRAWGRAQRAALGIPAADEGQAVADPARDRMRKIEQLKRAVTTGGLTQEQVNQSIVDLLTEIAS